MNSDVKNYYIRGRKKIWSVIKEYVYVKGCDVFLIFVIEFCKIDKKKIKNFICFFLKDLFNIFSFFWCFGNILCIM